jgi:hypothetical protein
VPNPATPKPLVLLVEGPDDKHVVMHLCRGTELDDGFDIQEKGGKEPLIAAIRNEVRVSGRKALGILLDADDDVQSRWDSVTHALSRADITAPEIPDPSGTIIENKNKPRIGIWLMPDNENPGELERFVAGMIPDSDPVWPRSQKYIDEIPVSDRKFKNRKTLRAQVHSWLATREEPRKMGAAIGIGDLDIRASDPLRLVEWLHRLFG